MRFVCLFVLIGGGSGGAILLAAAGSITSSGSLVVSGGQGGFGGLLHPQLSGGGGGGGRIAIYAQSFTQLSQSRIDMSGGLCGIRNITENNDLLVTNIILG